VRGSRRFIRTLSIAALVAAATVGLVVEPPPFKALASPRESSVSSACSIPHQWLLRTWRGYRADRGPELQILPTLPNFIGSGYPHAGPWGYDQNVPVLWYGPGYIEASGSVERPVTLTDIAPTQAELLGFPFATPDGKPMTEAIAPGAADRPPPKLVVTLVWDAGGRNVLSTWPNEWPYLRSLIPKGTWYDNATVGSSPTSTAQDHANIGTGSYPRTSGIVGHSMRIGNGIFGPFMNGPDLLVRPTLADLYDRANGNTPKIGEVATVNIHLGMLGHGSMWGGGDDDFLILRELPGATTQGAEGATWSIPQADARFFRIPSWIGSLPPLSKYFPFADAADGTVDGTWRGNDIAAYKGGFDTPARIPAQTEVIEQLVEREGFGADATPDMLLINYKLIDEVSHIWTMNSPEMQDSLRIQDEYLKILVNFLNRQVGRGQWVMAVTADHGAVPNVSVSGALQLSSGAILNALQARFDTDGDETPVIDLIKQTGIFVNMDELRQNGFDLDDLAEYILTLTAEQTVGDFPITAAQAPERVFQAAFPSVIMASLPCLPEARE
jgi:hypothetical protein